MPSVELDRSVTRSARAGALAKLETPAPDDPGQVGQGGIGLDAGRLARA